MTMDDDEVRAMESRLRQNGWTERASEERQSTKKRRPVAPPPKRFGSIESRVLAAARQLARDYNGYSWPMFSSVAEANGLPFDDAVRALLEAKRLAGEA